MTPEEVGARLAALLGAGAEASVSGGGGHARATVDVPPDRWSEAVRIARDELGLRLLRLALRGRRAG
jgi:hypothetical protein